MQADRSYEGVSVSSLWRAVGMQNLTRVLNRARPLKKLNRKRSPLVDYARKPVATADSSTGHWVDPSSDSAPASLQPFRRFEIV